MMIFIVQFEDVYEQQPERLPERGRHMQAHLAFLAAHGDRVVAAGALRAAADSAPRGGIWIIKADTQADVEALVTRDPFWKAGLRKSALVSHWAKAFWSPAFAVCMNSHGVKECESSCAHSSPPGPPTTSGQDRA